MLSFNIYFFYFCLLVFSEKQSEDISTKADLEKLNFILNKNLLEEDYMKSDINYKIAVLETKKAQVSIKYFNVHITKQQNIHFRIFNTVTDAEACS